MAYTIERANKKNLETILILFKNTIEKTCYKDYNNQQINAWISSIKNIEKWENRIDSQYFILAKENDKVVGFGSVEKNYLDLLFVHHEYLRKGVASLIYENLKIESTKKGFSKLTTFASKTALSFFINKGFSVIRKNKVMINEVEITNFEMSQ